MQVLCFAFGSNMLARRLRAPDRAPSARALGAAALPGHRLSFAKRGRDGSGKCTVDPTGVAEDRVHGVVYALDPGELGALDRAEGGYARVDVTVDMAGGPRLVQTYRALPHLLEPGLVPFDWYLAIVLAGAEYAGLPEAYVQTLRLVKAARDPDQARRGRHMALLPCP